MKRASFLMICGLLVIATNTSGQGPEITLTPSEYNDYNISCFGSKDGAIDATITGGTSPYTITWSNGAETEDISNVPSGLYIIRVVDAEELEGMAEITLTQPMAMKVDPNPYKYPNGYNISCIDCFNGSIDLTVANGVEPYAYLWSDAAPPRIDRILAPGSTPSRLPMPVVVR